MTPLESITISTDGETPGFHCVDRAEFYVQLDTEGVETWGCSRRTIALCEDPLPEFTKQLLEQCEKEWTLRNLERVSKEELEAML